MAPEDLLQAVLQVRRPKGLLLVPCPSAVSIRHPRGILPRTYE